MNFLKMTTGRTISESNYNYTRSISWRGKAGYQVARAVGSKLRLRGFETTLNLGEVILLYYVSDRSSDLQAKAAED